jgi:AraC family transcriptional regulator
LVPAFTAPASIDSRSSSDEGECPIVELGKACCKTCFRGIRCNFKHGFDMNTSDGGLFSLADVELDVPPSGTTSKSPGDSSNVSSNIQWQETHQCGTVYYRAAEKSEVAVVLDQHLLGVEITPGIVRTRLDGGGWSSDAMLAGALYFVEAGTYLRVRKEQPIDYILATVSPEGLQQAWDEAGFARSMPRIAFNLFDPVFRDTAWRLRKCFLSGSTDTADAASQFVQQAITLLARDIGAARRRVKYQIAQHQLRSAIEFINENIGSPLKIDVLAREAAGRSGYYFAHAFTEMMGCSPHQYILDRRLACAHELILRSKSTLAEISYRVGFSSQAHMTSTFSKRFGITPGRLRSSIR